MDKFNLNEWVGKGEKNLLNEGRDDDDFMTTISPEEQGVHDDDATRESSLEEEEVEEGVGRALKASFAALIAILGSKKMKKEIMAANMGAYGEEGAKVAELAAKIFKLLTGRSYFS